MLVSATQSLWSEAGNFCHSVLRVLRACCSLCSQLATLRVPERTLSAPAQVGRVSSSGTLSAAATVRTPPSIAAAKYMDIGIVSSIVTVTVSSQCRRRARASLDARTQNRRCPGATLQFDLRIRNLLCGHCGDLPALASIWGAPPCAAVRDR